jgi:integrase
LANEVGTQIGRFGSDGWIFPAPDGGPLRSSNFRHRVWAPAIRGSGLEGLRFHDLRHAHAAMLIQQGEHPRLISERLGHSSISVTMDVYGSLFPGMDEDAANRLDEVMRTAEAPDGSSVSNLP